MLENKNNNLAVFLLVGVLVLIGIIVYVSNNKNIDNEMENNIGDQKIDIQENNKNNMLSEEDKAEMDACIKECVEGEGKKLPECAESCGAPAINGQKEGVLENQKCGDGVCDVVESKNKELCPQDCIE